MMKKENAPSRRILRSYETVMLEIILLSQYRDSIRALSPRFYRSVQHRDEVYMAIIEALEDLEDELEEIEEAEGFLNDMRESNPKLK